MGTRARAGEEGEGNEKNIAPSPPLMLGFCGLWVAMAGHGLNTAGSWRPVAGHGCPWSNGDGRMFMIVGDA